jgi:hypothetical protein
MDLHQIESLFLTSIKKNTDEKLNTTRDDRGYLKVSIKSKCEEIGFIIAYIEPDEIMLSCKTTHVHINMVELKYSNKPQTPEVMVKEAVNKISNLMSDQEYISQTVAPNGELISSGWGPIAAIDYVNEEYETLLEEQYGKPILNKAYFWSGRLVER